MKSFFFPSFLWILVLTWGSCGAWAKTLNLSALDKKIQQNLLKELPKLKSADFMLTDLESAIRWLVQSGNYDYAQYSSVDGVQFNLKVGKTKRIHAIVFTGNNSISDGDLKTAFGISEQASFDPEALLEAAKKIQLYYKDQGFFNAVIDLEFIAANNSEYNVQLKITENTRSLFSQIQIETSNTSLEDQLKSLLSSYMGKAFTPITLRLMQKDIQNYFIKKHYFRAEVSDPVATFSKDEAQVYVTFKVEHPEAYFIDPPEPGKIPFNEVSDALNLSEYTSTAPNIAQELSTKIKAYYVSQGYPRVEVNVNDKEGVESFHRRLAIQVVEGPRVAIDKIEFTGRLSKPEKYYVNKLYDMSSDIFAKKRFVKDDLDRGLKNLVVDSQNNGYFKAKIISVRTLFNKDHDQVTIAINMDEGPLTQIQKISFDGNSQVSEKTLTDQLSLKPLAPLRLNALESGIEKIKKYYHDHGFLDMTLTNEQNEKENLVSYNEDNTLANLNFKIYEGPVVYVGSIVVEGNTITKDYVVLKELEFKNGDILTPALIDESIARLQRLGTFSLVEIKTLEEKTTVSRRTVLVKVSDRNPGLFNAGIGITNELQGTVRGFTGYAYRNIGGMARVFSARADVDEFINPAGQNNPPTFLERKASVEYSQPYLNDTRLRGRANLTDATFISDFSVFNAEDVLQFTLSLEEQVTSHLLLKWDLWSWGKYQTYNITGQDGLYPPTNVLIGSTGPTIELDYRDNAFNPTKGVFTRLNLEYGAPGVLQSSPQVNYDRAVLAVTDTLTVYKKIVWANQIRGGFVKNLEDANAGGYVPWVEKGFLLGGPSTIRGFTYKESFPNTNDLGSSNYNLTTDASMYLFKSELRIPIKGSFGMLLFYDGGAVNITGFNYGFSYRHSAGIGVIYNTPVGPASVDIGWKLNQIGSRGESPYTLDVAIGTF